jgi:hypothetical protein
MDLLVEMAHLRIDLILGQVLVPGLANPLPAFVSLAYPHSSDGAVRTPPLTGGETMVLHASAKVSGSLRFQGMSTMIRARGQ